MASAARHKNRGRNRVWTVLAGLHAAFWFAMTVALVAMAFSQSTDEPGFLLIVPVFLGIGIASARFARRAAGAGVSVSQAEVIVDGPWRTRRLRTSTVESFEAGLQPSNFGNPVPGILVQRVDGSPVSVWSLASEGLVWNSQRNAQRWDRTAAQLNEELRHAKGT